MAGGESRGTARADAPPTPAPGPGWACARRGAGPCWGAALAVTLIAASAPGACGGAQGQGGPGRACAPQDRGLLAQACGRGAWGEGGCGGGLWPVRGRAGEAGGEEAGWALQPRLRGGGAGPPPGSARALWDAHKFGSEHGIVAIFRHKDLGTAVELNQNSQGDFAFVERDGGNSSYCASHGEVLPMMSPTGRQFVVNGTNILDPDDGFVAPDLLYELRRQPGMRPMVAEWMDCGHWEAWDDGTKPYIRVLNLDSNCTLALTKDGFIFVGADAGPEQPRKPWGLVVKDGGKAEKVTQAEAKRLLAAL